MNIQATHALPAGSLLLLDGQRVKSPGTDRTALALVPATPRELRLAVAVVLLSVLAFAAAIPFARVPLPKIAAFIPSYESALAINDLVTAVLLFGRVARRRSRAYLALACGYLFNAAIIVPHALSFPGVFSETGLLGAGSQTTAWLFVFWHGGFPLFVLGYALLPEQDRTADFLHKHAGRVIALAIVGVIAIVAALTMLATTGHDLLPEIIRGGDYSLLISTGVSPTIVVLSALALFALWWRRERAVLDVWLMVVMCVWLLDVMLSAVVSSLRYDLGWYGGRSYGLLASCCLLIVLLFEMNRLYGRLADALSTAGTLQEHLTFRAENDSLTSLPNRALFYDRLETAMTRCRRTKQLMALLYIDIDHFKKINDNYGHAAGDDLLRLFAQRLTQCVRASDTVARLGGDEFTVILENLTCRETAQDVVDKLIGALRHPYGTAEENIQARASIGVAYFSGEDLKADGLVKQADAALYRAKHGGRNRYWVHKSATASVLQP
jgi:diguanylate cyclase (GGDEF)-like protein